MKIKHRLITESDFTDSIIDDIIFNKDLSISIFIDYYWEDLEKVVVTFKNCKNFVRNLPHGILNIDQGVINSSFISWNTIVNLQVDKEEQELIVKIFTYSYEKACYTIHCQDVEISAR